MKGRIHYIRSRTNYKRRAPAEMPAENTENRQPEVTADNLREKQRMYQPEFPTDDSSILRQSENEKNDTDWIEQYRERKTIQ